MLETLKLIVTKEIDKLYTKSNDNTLSTEDFNTLFMLMNQVERITLMEASQPVVS